MTKKLITIMLAVLFGANVFADVAISDVKVFSGYPWKEVIIGYTITGNTNDLTALQVQARDNEVGKTYECHSLEGVDLSAGAHTIKWNADADGAKFKSDDVVFSVRLIKPIYCVINLSGGTNPTNYTVSYMEQVPEGGWTDEYKTTNIVLRLVESEASTTPFYIGVFEVTQKQYELVMGSNPAANKGDMRPVESLSWNTIRGNGVNYDWPNVANVDTASFMGKMQSHTGFVIDLPTIAQWVYACSAGTTNRFNNGGDNEADLAKLGRYAGNTSDGRGGAYQQHTTVGSYAPNAWGLYDMHGNVAEWTLDPRGKVQIGSDQRRGWRGGSYGVTWLNCSKWSENTSYSESVSAGIGFRLVRTLSE